MTKNKKTYQINDRFKNVITVFLSKKVPEV